MLEILEDGTPAVSRLREHLLCDCGLPDPSFSSLDNSLLLKGIPEEVDNVVPPDHRLYVNLFSWIRLRVEYYTSNITYVDLNV